MRLITDWHAHSKYSRACSKDLELPTIAQWCERKGIDVVATSDWTHPKWFTHLREYLQEAGDGIFSMKNHASNTRFMLVTEISQIYKRAGKTRRIHNLVFAPSFEAVEKVNAEFDRRNWNRASDGRPIIGCDSEEFYRILKSIDERIVLIPAHAWTPWYSVFGSKSGFDSLEECFGEMTPYIHAIETGLSSNPQMNWRVPGLDNIAFISNSDAHSPRNFGREANVFDLPEPSYDAFMRALRTRDPKQFLSTIEFFPEEGKYHWDGCADSLFSCDPRETKKHNGRCPTCGKLLTIGVESRVEDLAQREPHLVDTQRVPFHSIVPLEELIAEVFGVRPQSKRVRAEYIRLTDRVGSEFMILLDAPIAQIQQEASQPLIAEAVRRVRAGAVSVTPGYDGIYGKIRVFPNGIEKKTQTTLV